MPSSDSNDPQFAARLDAVFSRWDEQVRKELREAYVRKRRGRRADGRPTSEVVSQELHKVEQELSLAREEISKARRAASEWENKATLALKEEEFSLAREAVLKVGEYLETAAELSLDEEILDATASQLRRLLDHLSERSP